MYFTLFLLFSFYKKFVLTEEQEQKIVVLYFEEKYNSKYIHQVLNVPVKNKLNYSLLFKEKRHSNS